MAESTMWLAIAKILAAFDISKPKDAQGREIEQNVGFISAITESVPAFFLSD